MSQIHILIRGLLRVLTPTPLQILGSVFVALLLLIGVQTGAVLSAAGVSPQALELTSQHWAARFRVVLESPLVAHVALVIFWAAIGLLTYLICWAGYNLWVTTRNEVTIETQYTNKGQWDGVLESLAIKALAALALVLYLFSFQVGLVTWLALTSGLFSHLGAAEITSAAVAVLGLALQLYGLLMLLQLAFTPWYRPGAFTD